MNNAPVARKRPFKLSKHGHERIDNYYWLREKENAEVIAHLEAENAYCDSVMAHTKDLQETLYNEMLSRIQEDDDTVPIKKGNYFYYSRTEAGKAYAIYCRKKGSLDAPEEILLDLNQEAQGHDYLRLGMYKISPNHELLAYSLDTDGHEDYIVRVKNLKTSTLLPDQIFNTTYALEWGNDNKTLFYTVEDSAKRPYKVFRHSLGTNPSDDVELFHEQDERFNVSLSKTKDGQYLMHYSSSKETEEVYTLNADEPLAEFTLAQPRITGLRYSVEHRKGLFYLLTNADGAVNQKLVSTAVDKPNKDNWQTLIEHNPNIERESLELFNDYLVIYERENGLRTIRTRNIESQDEHLVNFPEDVYSYELQSNPESNSQTLRFEYNSLITPATIYDYNMHSKQLELKKQKTVLGGYNPQDYLTTRLFATADDGTQIPLSIVHKKDLELNGKNPCMLYGYGSYGIVIEPEFSSERLSLLERGFVFAIAHIRGSSTMGRQWYEDGKYLNKKNTFTDFIACAQKLIDSNYTNPDHLVTEGRSAGGLLMSAVLNLAPQLFKAAIAGVPFVDVISTMLDASIPLTVNEYEEWGNPNDKSYYDYMLSYSPYDHVEAKNYPNILVTAGLNDPRVHYWEPAKWTAKLRELKTDNNTLILKTDMGAGHFGESGRYGYLKREAFEQAFLLDSLNMI